MADKGFGIRQLNLIGASGTPKIESPNNLNLNATTVAISTDVTIGGQVTSNIIVGTGKSVGIGLTNPSAKLDVNGSIKASQYGTLGNFSAQLGQIRVGGDEYGNTIKVVNDTNMNIIANNQIYINTGAATNGSTNGSNVAYFGTNGLYLPSGKGIDFSATANSSGTMTSELLSDYEEGTWTPVDSDGDAYTTNKLSTYTRVGRLVWAMCDVTATSTANGTKIGGLPFTAFGQSGTNFAGNYPCFNGYTSGPDARMNGHINSGTSQITLFVGSTETSLTNGQRIIITALYLA